ncbi:hypothetical protein, variant [Saprolegnia diclina VS20]|uniref:Tubby C-terminal domain-containing protein n=1 Tax=Saprolegnia diclina (strain VS20) TaxID=1156394 RepID=T0QHW4_SAPDV|nr:hypothetical protein, variant [Saprolegnia diclina VS20]EQC33305.1 hypothetical protein, variant [Saprolegnia diclina VS20]|eukprot:XP_008613428.1 hypothetical protein, variant [Saprolegnia diclina VS20]
MSTASSKSSNNNQNRAPVKPSRAWDLDVEAKEESNQVIRYEADEDDDSDGHDGKDSEAEDSEDGDDPKNVSVACSEWLSAAGDTREPSKIAEAKIESRYEKTRVPHIETKLDQCSLAGNQSGEGRFDATPFLPLSVLPGSATALHLTEGSIVRCNHGANRLTPQYQFFIKNKLVLLAQKQLNNRTSNYHIFDMSRGAASYKLSKKSGNYIGKLRSSFGRQENVMISAQAEKRELGAILFETKTSHSKPRKLTVICPGLTSSGEAKSVPSKGDAFSSLAEQVKLGRTSDLVILDNKDPEYEKGCYRLNFNGRVSVPSVKNFQLVLRGTKQGVILQFGKVSDKLFHLDFRHPMTPFQAFSIALSQFNY